MLQIKKHVASKVLVVLLTVVLITPLFVKLTHLFENHNHEVCKTPNTDHFHELEIDCAFYDFNLNTNFCQSLPTFKKLKVNKIDNNIISQYHYISDYQRLHFSLRGPPLSV